MKPYRTFLGKTGAAMVNLTFGDNGKNIDLTITDCYRRIELDFSCYTKQQKKERLDKLAKLEFALQSIRTTLEGLDVPVKRNEEYF